jgi:hypothetical protein
MIARLPHGPKTNLSDTRCPGVTGCSFSQAKTIEIGWVLPVNPCGGWVRGRGTPLIIFKTSIKILYPNRYCWYFFPQLLVSPLPFAALGRGDQWFKKKNSPALDTGVFIEMGTPTGRKTWPQARR